MRQDGDCGDRRPAARERQRGCGCPHKRSRGDGGEREREREVLDQRFAAADSLSCVPCVAAEQIARLESRAATAVSGSPVERSLHSSASPSLLLLLLLLSLWRCISTLLLLRRENPDPLHPSSSFACSLFFPFTCADVDREIHAYTSTHSHTSALSLSSSAARCGGED